MEAKSQDGSVWDFCERAVTAQGELDPEYRRMNRERSAKAATKTRTMQVTALHHPGTSTRPVLCSPITGSLALLGARAEEGTLGNGAADPRGTQISGVVMYQNWRCLQQVLSSPPGNPLKPAGISRPTAKISFNNRVRWALSILIQQGSLSP